MFLVLRIAIWCEESWGNQIFWCSFYPRIWNQLRHFLLLSGVRVVQIGVEKGTKKLRKSNGLSLTIIDFPHFYRICVVCSGGDATRSVPERADKHVRAEHGEGLRVGHHEAM